MQAETPWGCRAKETAVYAWIIYDAGLCAALSRSVMSDSL